MLNYKDILVYGGSIIGDEVFGTFTENFSKKRIERKIKIKAVIGKTIPKHMQEKSVQKLTEIKSLPIFEKHKSVYFIYGNNLLIVSLGQNIVAIRVSDNPVLIESQKAIFNFFWTP